MSLLTYSKTLIIGLASVAFSIQAHGTVSQEQWRDLNLSIVNGHILPAYQALSESSTALEENTLSLCKAPQTATLDAAKTQFKATLSAWQGAQHISFGPIELLMRSYSIQFWPDKKNLTSKQLNKILQAEDPGSLSEEAFQTASIAVKGLPAMERILFAENALEAIQTSPFRCQFLHAVSDYVKLQSRNTYNEWNAFKDEFAHLESEEGLYETAQEASVDLMKAQIEPLEVIRDLKILRPLAKNTAKPRRLESWRSNHSLQNMQLNIQSLHHMYSGVAGANLKALLEEQGAIDLAQGIEEQFVGLEKILNDIPTPLHQHIKDVSVREKLLLVSEGIELLGKSFAQAMKLLDVQLGFNSRDGD